MKRSDNLKVYWLGKQLITMYAPEPHYTVADAVLGAVAVLVIAWTLWMVCP